MFKYRLMISDFYKIPIDNVEKLVPNVFDKKKVCPSLLKLATLFKVEIKTKAGTSRIT